MENIHKPVECFENDNIIVMFNSSDTADFKRLIGLFRLLAMIMENQVLSQQLATFLTNDFPNILINMKRRNGTS